MLKGNEQRAIHTTYEDLRYFARITHMLNWDDKNFIDASCWMAEREERLDPVDKLIYHFAAKVLDDICHKYAELDDSFQVEDIAIIFNALGLPGYEDYVEEE